MFTVKLAPTKLLKQQNVVFRSLSNEGLGLAGLQYRSSDMLKTKEEVSKVNFYKSLKVAVITTLNLHSIIF